MVRLLSKIVAAILLTQPEMPEVQAKSYARAIDRYAQQHDFDPYTMVAMAHYESTWREGVGDGRCWGLMGVCASTFRSCQVEPSGAECAAKTLMLLNGHENIRVASDLITLNREFCQSKTGRSKFRHWLASYQGANKPNRGIWCGQRRSNGRWVDVRPHPYTARVVERRLWLIRRLG